MKYQRVEGHPDYVREPKVGAILLQNTSEVDKYKLTKKSRQELISRISILEKEVEDLKKIVSSIINGKS